MVMGFVIVAAWFICSVMVAFLVGGAVRLRDELGRPASSPVRPVTTATQAERIAA